MKHNVLKLATLGLVVTTLAVPAMSEAQSRDQLRRRQQQKNQWRNIGYGSAAVGLYGLLKGDRNLAILGGAGAAYSAHRYEQDRKSQRRLQDQARYGRYQRYSNNSRDYRYYSSSSRKNKKSPRGNAYGYWKKRG